MFWSNLLFRLLRLLPSFLLYIKLNRINTAYSFYPSNCLPLLKKKVYYREAGGNSLFSFVKSDREIISSELEAAVILLQ